MSLAYCAVCHVELNYFGASGDSHSTLPPFSFPQTFFFSILDPTMFVHLFLRQGLTKLRLA